LLPPNLKKTLLISSSSNLTSLDRSLASCWVRQQSSELFLKLLKTSEVILLSPQRIYCSLVVDLVALILNEKSHFSNETVLKFFREERAIITSAQTVGLSIQLENLIAVIPVSSFSIFLAVSFVFLKIT
jgi:hypothetical protein